MKLEVQQLNRLRLVLAREPHVRRAIFVEGGPRPLLAFEYDERPPSVEAAQVQIERLVATVAPALGSAATTLGFSAGGPEEIARLAAGGTVVYDRDGAA